MTWDVLDLTWDVLSDLTPGQKFAKIAVPANVCCLSTAIAVSLQVLVNDRIVSYQMQGKDSTRKGALDPPEIMVGCHKDADMDEYGHYLTASLDELAIWHRRLVDNNTIYFLGGYGEC